VSTDVLLEVVGVGKRYPRVHRRLDRVRSVLDAVLNRPYRAHAQILQDIDFTLKRGESLALIGENGAGKSTLLRMICGIAEPSAGRVRLRGTVAPLLELGAGFHPEYSGRDNIRMNALLLGMARPRSTPRCEQVIDFAELGDYIDEPVKHYSSGMKVRLGFAVVASRAAGPADHRRGPGGRRRVLPEEVHRLDRGLPGGGRHAAAGQPQHVPRAEALQARAVAAPWAGEAYGDVFDVTQRYLAYHERKTAQPSRSGARSATRRLPVVAVVALNGEDRDGPAGALAGAGTEDVDVDLHSADGRPPVLVVGMQAP
jgi:lipopolysaccharide transport system ATP-binding protein